MASLSLSDTALQGCATACVFGENPHAILEAWSSRLSEDELCRLEICIPSSLWVSDVAHPQAFVHRIDLQNIEESAKELAWKNLWQPITFHLQEGLNPEHKVSGEHFFTALAETKLGVDLVASEYCDLGIRALQNIWKNLLLLPKAHNLLSLKDSMRGVPVCICGAGPSLIENTELIKALKGKALFFAGGSAPSALSNLGITPDLMGHIDPNPPRERIRDHLGFEVPLVYENRLAHDILESSHGLSMWLPSNETYPIEHWLYELIGISVADWDGGWNVATVLTSVATWLGCDPIIFVGVDLSGKAKDLYAKGVLGGDAEENSSLPKDKEGNIYRTDWAIARIWMEEWIAKHPHHHFFQCKTFSSPFKGTALFNDNAIAQMEYFDTQGLVHSICQKADPVIADQENVLRAFKKMLVSFSNAQIAVERLIELWQTPSSKSPEDSGKFALYWSDLTDEPVYQKLILPIWGVWQHIFPRFCDLSQNETLQKLLFFKRVLQNHRQILEEANP